LISRRSAFDRLVPALRDVSFHVPKGSVLAIIGRNGAGKSTLCRVISGILPPESGRVIVRGNMNLLAPGLGFSDALTGRENITLGGLASGLAPERLAELADEIAEFAQLESYLDLPMRAYSGGMRMRLASSIAVFLDPEILLIDEALTGGDAAFTEHIAEKTAQLMSAGRTIVLVTHGLSSAKRMATQALWLHQGRVAEFGDPDEVVNKYMRYCRLESLTLDDI
jgi:ABC-type polysaccharide/polyol phosphate transport system ATPase subunit